MDRFECSSPDLVQLNLVRKPSTLSENYNDLKDAIQGGNLRKFKSLLYQVDIDETFEIDSEIFSVLSYCIRCSRIEFCEILLGQCKADPNLPMENPPLLTCMKNDKPSIAMKLIEYDADIFVLDRDKSTLLILAARNGNSQVVKTLVDLGVDLNNQNSFGRTALMEAVLSGDKRTVLTLLSDPRCGVNFLDNEMKTAVDHAFDQKRTSLASAIRNRGRGNQPRSCCVLS